MQEENIREKERCVSDMEFGISRAGDTVEKMTYTGNKSKYKDHRLWFTTTDKQKVVIGAVSVENRTR